MDRIGVEIERKYIIEKPSLEDMKLEEGFTESDILQIYLASESGLTHRIRARKSECGTVYTETKKIRIDRMSSTELEREISESEFSVLKENIREGSSPINKKRYTFLYKGQLFEIDFYPEWESSAIMETELESRQQQVDFPEFIRVIQDVTGVKEYSNSSMANSFPSEKM